MFAGAPAPGKVQQVSACDPGRGAKAGAATSKKNRERQPRTDGTRLRGLRLADGSLQPLHGAMRFAPAQASSMEMAITACFVIEKLGLPVRRQRGKLHSPG